MIRQSADWMVIWDDRLMEVLATDGPSTPTKLSSRDEIIVTTPHVSNRLSKLADHGLLNPFGNGVYSINIEGIGYLMGDYDAQGAEWINHDQEEDEQLPVFEDDGYMISKKFHDNYGFFNSPPQED